MALRFTLGFVLVVLLPFWPILGQSRAAIKTRSPAQNFVQKFYDWYMPIVQRPRASSAFDIVRDRPYLFSPRLFRALKQDSDAQAKSDELVGLDFDPFLNTQDPGDPGDHYEVGKVEREGDTYSVEVFGGFSGEKSDKPEVLAKVARRNGRWVFVNFYYLDPPADDLLSVLRRLAKDRQRPVK